LAAKGERSASVAIRRKKGKKYGVEFARIELRDVAAKTRHMPPEFIRGHNDVTDAFIAYCRPLVGQLPTMARTCALSPGPRWRSARTGCVAREGRRARPAAEREPARPGPLVEARGDVPAAAAEPVPSRDDAQLREVPAWNPERRCGSWPGPA